MLINYDHFSSSIIFRLVPVLLLIFVIINEALINGNVINIFQKKIILLFVFVFIIIIGVLTSSKPLYSVVFKVFKCLSLFVFLLASIIIIYNFRYRGILNVFVKFFFLPFLFYVTLNLLFFLVGITGDDSVDSKSVLLSYIGTIGTRVNFYLSAGVNAYGSVLGVLLTFSLVGFGVVKKYKKYFLIGVLVSLISLFLTDSRGPMVYAFLIFFLVRFLSFFKKPIFLNLVPIIGFIGPFILLFFLSLISTTSFGESLSRNSGDFASGNSRLPIWTIAVSDFLVFKPEHHIFGYGEFGHHTSGLSPIWASIFDGQEENHEFIHPHNTFLSIMFDYGYLGLLIYLIFQYKVINIIKRFWQSQKEISMFLLSNLLYFNFVGIGETMFGFYYRNVMYIFFIVNIFALVINLENKPKKYNQIK
jgi:O-antigen ligase